MLSCHQSQQDWLKKHHDIEYMEALKEWSAKRGSDIGVAFAEGFRQHLGSAFPTDNVLANELGDLVHTR